MPKINYDKQSNTVSIKMTNTKSVDSDIQDNIVIDYDQQGKITNLDILDFTLKEFTQAKTYLTQLIKKAKNQSILKFA